MNDIIESWRERARDAASKGQPQCLRGGGSKDFYGRSPRGEVWDLRANAGVVNYEPTELVLTARGGTPLAEIERVLAEQGQMLAFEPPHFGEAATLGGMIASGLSGPGRQATGGVRDFVLGVTLLDGRGNVLHFGGEVMKNVAGYDVSRVLCGSLGTLGVVLEVSLKVLPRPRAEHTLRFELDEDTALRRMNEWAAQPLPVSATCWHAEVLHVRLSGAQAAVDAAVARLGGASVAAAEAEPWWNDLREHRASVFCPRDAEGEALWRCALPSTAPALGLAGEECIEWGGGQRWLRSTLTAEVVRDRVQALGGHATCFRGGKRDAEVFQRPAPALMRIHERLKRSFDPAGIFNPGRLYEGL